MDNIIQFPTGSNPETIDVMGLKNKAKEIAVSAGVPTITGYQGTKQDVETLEKEAKVKHSNRGAAAGKISKKKLPKFIGQMTKVDKYRAYYKSKDGIQRKDNISNNVSSGIIGYYDRPDRNSYRKTKGKQTIIIRS